jgi:hypothetical protein
MLLKLVVAPAIVVLWVCGAAVAQEAGSARRESAVLRGTVVNALTHQPLGRALVLSGDSRFATMTDERGRFEMVFKEKKAAPEATPRFFPQNPQNLGSPPAVLDVAGDAVALAQSQTPTLDRPEYLLARKNGFLFESEGMSGVAIARDQEEVTISLMPEAHVVGHVTLVGGEGAEGMQVKLFKRQVQAGRSRWIGAGQVEARSDGEFRFADVEPGSYKLFSEELLDRDPVTSDPRGQLYGYPPLYYPAAADFASGAVIQLAAGETFQAVLSSERRKYYPVRIGLTNAVTGFMPEITVSRAGHEGPGYSLGYNFRDGTIMGSLPDGNYTVKVLSRAQSVLAGMANVAVHGGPLTGAMIALVSGSSIDVRVNEEFSHSQGNGQGEAAQAVQNAVSQKQHRANYVQVTLVPVEEFDVRAEYSAQQPNDPEKEGLVIESVPPGRYRVHAQTPLGYVASVRCGDTDLQHSNLEIGLGAKAAPIEVTLRDDGAEVDGSVVELAKRNQGATGSGFPSVQAGVVYLVPMLEGGDMTFAWVQPNGDFQFPQVPPGSYRVLAFDRQQTNLEYMNDEAMARYDAQVITLVPGQREHLRVSLAGRSE